MSAVLLPKAYQAKEPWGPARHDWFPRRWRK